MGRRQAAGPPILVDRTAQQSHAGVAGAAVHA